MHAGRELLVAPRLRPRATSAGVRAAQSRVSSALLFIAAIPAGLAAGCFLSLEGYEGPPEAPPQIEAGPSDVGAGSDGARRFCDTRTPGVIFCDDFDDDAGFGKGRLKNVLNGSVEIDSVHASSPPHALHVASDAAAPMASNFIVESTNTSARFTRVAFDLLVGAGAVSGKLGTIAEISIDGSNVCRFQMGQGERLLEIDVVPSRVAKYHPPTLFNLADGKWHRVELTIDAARQPANVGYSIDGQTLLNSATRVTGAPWKSGLVTVQLGADATGGAGLDADIVLHFDNLLVSNE